jgi:hypothetical protein
MVSAAKTPHDKSQTGLSLRIFPPLFHDFAPIPDHWQPKRPLSVLNAPQPEPEWQI